MWCLCVREATSTLNKGSIWKRLKIGGKDVWKWLKIGAGAKVWRIWPMGAQDLFFVFRGSLWPFISYMSALLALVSPRYYCLLLFTVGWLIWNQICPNWIILGWVAQRSNSSSCIRLIGFVDLFTGTLHAFTFCFFLEGVEFPLCLVQSQTPQTPNPPRTNVFYGCFLN